MIVPPFLGLTTGEQAIEHAKAVLHAFEVPGPYRLAGLSRRAPQGFDPGGWAVTLQTKPGRYAVVFGPNDRVRYVDRPNDVGGMIPNVKDPKAAARVSRWLARYRPAFPVRPSFDPGATSFFTFQGLVKGLPVVYPRTSLGYSFVLKNGQLHEFGAHEDMPSVPSPVPRLSEADALAAVDRAFHAQNPPRGGWTFSYRLYDRRELGWVLPDGGGPARLAWRVPFMAERHGQFGTQGGSSGMLIDATTGEPIRTKTVP